MTATRSTRDRDAYPESKLELIDGRLIAGNSPAGSRYLLWDILGGWGTVSALPMAPAALWWQALNQGFRQFQPPSPDKPAAAWQAWAAQLSYEPEIAPAGPPSDWKHYDAAIRLRMGLFEATHQKGLGISLGPDCALKLGDNAFTPDVFLVTRERLGTVLHSYTEGPADLVIEVLLPGHEAQDREVKARYYAAACVPEYWLIDPAANAAELLCLERGHYRKQAVGADGRYRPPGVPGLVLLPARLWEGDRWSGDGPQVIEVDQTFPPVRWPEEEEGGLRWGSLPFDPRPGLEPVPLLFDEFIAWCGRAKFERIKGRPLIGGTYGTRNVLGMLLRTFGLTEAVTLLHPRQWVEGLLAAEQARRNDPARKADWWAAAHRAAALLRDRYGFGRLAVIGDLTQPEPLSLWSDITLVAWDVPRIEWEVHEALFKMLRGTDIDVELREAEHLTSAQRQELEEMAVEI
jgi:Uma2 family endonuclease